MKTLILACIAAAAPAAFAQTWVSINYGNDANACTRYYPCLTFQHAENVTASGGRINVLDPGDYGPVIITKAITIDGGNFASMFSTVAQPIVVEAGAGQSVQLKNMSLQSNGGAYGVYYVSGGQLQLQNVSFSGFATGVYAAITGTGMADLVLDDTKFDNCTKGLVVNSSSIALTVEIANSRFRDGSSYAVTINTGTVSIANSHFSGAAGYGLELNGGMVMVDNCQFSNLYYAIFAYNPYGTQVNRTTFSHNYYALFNGQGQGGPIYTNGNNSFFNNYNQGTQWTTLISLH